MHFFSALTLDNRYVLSILVDIRTDVNWLSKGVLKALSLGATLILLAPGSYDLLARPDRPTSVKESTGGTQRDDDDDDGDGEKKNQKRNRIVPSSGEAAVANKVQGERCKQSREAVRLLLALFNSGMAFFLCSFQVHEKSFLLPLTPLSFLVLEDPVFVGWMSCVAAFSMYPLLHRDGLTVAYWGSTILFLLALRWTFTSSSEAAFTAREWWRLPKNAKSDSLSYTARRWLAAARTPLVLVSCTGMLVLHVLHASLAPPARYPDLYALLFSVWSFLHFVFAWAYGVFWQFSIDL